MENISKFDNRTLDLLQVELSKSIQEVAKKFGISLKVERS